MSWIMTVLLTTGFSQWASHTVWEAIERSPITAILVSAMGRAGCLPNMKCQMASARGLGKGRSGCVVNAAAAGGQKVALARSLNSVAGEPKVAVIRSVDSEEGETQIVRVIKVSDSGDSEPCVAVVHTDDGDGTERKIVRVLAKADVAGGENKVWLGVLLDDVPEAVAAQLPDGVEGIMVRNIAKGSAAEAAGLQQHDVIISIAGQNLGDGMAHAAEIIGARKPGETVDIVIFRTGKQSTVRATLGSRADRPDEIQWKFENADAEVEEHVQTRGKILRRGPGDSWIAQDLGDLHKLGDLSEHLKAIVPKSGSRSTQVQVHGSKKKVSTKVERDGASITVEQEGDDDITLRRTDQSGNETVAEFSSMEDLRAKDPEAADMLRDADRSYVFHLDIDGVGGIGPIQLDLEGLDEEMGEWNEKIEDKLEAAKEAYESAIESAGVRVEELMEKWKTDGFADEDHAKAFAFGMKDGKFKMFAPHFGKARQSFKVLDNGQIEVHIRKGDSEMVKTFANETDLAQRDPKLFEKYQGLKEEDQE